MLPVLFNIGPFAVSSFGLFLSLGVFAAVFTAFRLARLYDLSEEKVIDLAILTFFGGMIGARIFFVVTNLSLFSDLNRIILLTRYPGLSFWGGLMGGVLTFWFFATRLKFNFWQIADLAAVSALLGIVWGDIGCFLSGCSVGVPSSLPIATPVVGVIGNRLPIEAIEAVILLFLYFQLFKQTIRFHFAGKIVALVSIYLGIVKLGTEYYRSGTDVIFNISGHALTLGHVFSLAFIVSGTVVFYHQSRRNLGKDILEIASSVVVTKKRQAALFKLRRNWYNQRVSGKVWVSNMTKTAFKTPIKLQRKLNVKPNPREFK